MQNNISTIKKNEEILRVLKSRNRIYSKEFTIFYKKNENKKRVAFIVSKKISKKAVVRNKIKRQLRNIVYKNLKNSTLTVDIVIMVKPEYLNKDFNFIENSFSYLIRKMK